MLSPYVDLRLFVIWVYLTVITSAALTALLAGTKGYNRPLWFLAGLFVPKLLVVLFLPNLNKMTNDSKRLRWEFATDFGPFLGYCLFLLLCCHLLLLLCG